MAATFRNAPLFIALLLIAGAALVIWNIPSPPPDQPPKHLADLGSTPDWKRLDPYQGTITRTQFVELLEDVYTIGSTWKQLIEVDESAATITTHPGDAPYKLAFAPETSAPTPPRYWRSAKALDLAPKNLPLQGLHIAIDPGHIGGEYAQMEARWFQVGPDQAPVMEGEMTLLTAKHLRTRLETLGAKVSMVRESNAPVTSARSKDFEEIARLKLGNSVPAEVRATAERLFYRTSEIRARAKTVNDVLQPDLVLCLHFNAEGWGDPNAPQLSTLNHFHILLNGAYTSDEVLHDDERLEMLLKIVQQIHPEERAIAQDMITAFQEITALPPYQYEPLSRRAIKLGDSSYLWARNLLANRLYECPVLFLEPYVMNSVVVHARAQAGDYEGLRTIEGVSRPSIYREYADAVALGIERYYRSHRTP